MVYTFNNPWHGKRAKRSIEGPQICTQAKQLAPEVIRGSDFVAVRQSFQYRTAAPGKKTGSRWSQLLVFPAGQRYFVSMDRIDAVNSSDAMFLRIDMPGHIRHKQGDTFEEIYLSYLGSRGPAAGRPASSSRILPPTRSFSIRGIPTPFRERFIRAYRLRDPATGRTGPWLAGMTLDPGVVYEAWCHQRGYVCMIQEFGGRPVPAGGSFSAAFIVGYFDSIEEMHAVYDRYRGATALAVSPDGWRLGPTGSE